MVELRKFLTKWDRSTIISQLKKKTNKKDYNKGYRMGYIFTTVWQPILLIKRLDF